MPRSRCRPRSRSRICAWIGHVERRRRLVGDQQARVAGDGHRDHHALVHAAGELVRKVASRRDAAPECRPARAARSRDCAPPCGPGSGAAAASPRAGSRSVKQGLRLVVGSWKIIATSSPMILRRSRADSFEQVAAGEAQRARTHPAGKCDEPHHREHRDALARARFADDAQHVALVERQAHALDRVQHAALRRETRRAGLRSRGAAMAAAIA